MFEFLVRFFYIFLTDFVIIKISIKFISKADLSLIFLTNYEKFKIF